MGGRINGKEATVLIGTRYGRAMIQRASYPNGALAVRLVGAKGEPIAVLSVNLPEHADELGPREFFAKTWSENEGIAADALASGLFADTGRRVVTGFVEAQVWRFVSEAGTGGR